MSKKSFARLMSLEKSAFEKSSKKSAPTKRAAAKDESDPLWLKRTVTPELVVEMQQEDSESEMYQEDSDLLVEMYQEDSDATMENPTADAEVITLLKRILEQQNRLEERMIKLETTINDLVTSTEKNKRSKAEDMAREKVMRECKALSQKVHKTVSRFTGEDENEQQIDVAAALPISSLEAAQDINEKMRDKEYYYAMKLYLVRLKSCGADFEGILRKLYSDKFLSHCNWEGRHGKHALMQFSLAAELLYDCSDFPDRGNFDASIRKCISKSHHRMEQRRHFDRVKMKKAKMQ